MKISNIDLIIQNIFKRNIKNCKDSLKDEITQYVLNSFNGKINKANVYAHIKEKYIFPAVGSNTKSYWRSRGYSEDEFNCMWYDPTKITARDFLKGIYK